MATDDYAKIEHDMAAMLRESFPVTWPPGLATKLSLQQVPQLIYKEKGTLLIPKKLFEVACDEIMPLFDTTILMISKMVIVTTFAMMILNSVLTLTPGEEYGSVASAVVTFCAISIARLLSLISEDQENEQKLEELKIAQRLKNLVKNYSEEHNLTDNHNDQNNSNEERNLTNDQNVQL